jgi:hypothetical protein
MAATTTLLDLVTPTQGTLSGTWGDTVNYGITDYLDIAIAGTLSFANDGAITLVNTIGSASGNAITTTTAQYMVIRVTGTLTTPKIITAPSRSKLYMVDNAATGDTVSFIRAGQTPAVSVAVGEKCFVYYNGTDYVKVASSVVSASSLTGIVGPANGGTGVANNAASTLTISGAFATALTVTGATGVTLPTTGTLATLAGSETLTNKTISGASNTLTVDGTNKVGYLNIPNSGAKTTSYTLAIGDVGKFIELGTGGDVVVPPSVFAAGDAISIFNNTSGSISCTCSAVTTVYKAGTDADISTFSITTRGVATVLFISATVAVVTGNLA